MLHLNQIRDAASVILIRRPQNGEVGVSQMRLLMGQRAAKAAFKPQKFVFPGGAVDPEDAHGGHKYEVSDVCLKRLSFGCDPASARALLNAAVRELHEETGLVLRRKACLKFVYRAITPPRQTRRFDARFFVVEATDVVNDLDDFTAAQDELSNLKWVTFSEALFLNVPHITALILRHVEGRMAHTDQSAAVPFYDMRLDDGELKYIE